MPLRSVIQSDRRSKALASGGVVDEQGRVVTCVTHSGGCRYRPPTIWDSTNDIFWAVQADLPSNVRERFFPGGGSAMNPGAISKYRASLPCTVVELTDEEIRENQRRAKAEALWRARRNAGYQDPRDEELDRLIRQKYAERNRQERVPDTFRRTTPAAFEEGE